MSRTHLHKLDAPHAVAILDAVIGARRPGGPDAYERTNVGAFVDFDALRETFLSTTEIACVDIARAVATIERHGGGLPSRVRRQVTEAIKAVTDG